MESVLDIEEAIKLTGYGRFNVGLWIVCGGCLFAVTVDAYSIGYLLPAAQCDMNLDTVDKGILTSMTFVGIIFSSHYWGYLADTKGRKYVLLLSLFVTFVCSFASVFSTNFIMFAVLRFFVGLFGSCPSATVYAYLGEFHCTKYRTMSITCISMFIAIAIIVIPAVAWTVIPLKWTMYLFGMEFKTWRLFLSLCSLPWLLVAIMLIPFPESPKFLLAQGRKLQALEVLRKVYSCNTGRHQYDFPVEELKQDEKIDLQPGILKSLWHQTKPLFTYPYTFVTCFLQFGLYVISGGLLLWYPDIVNNFAEHSSSNSKEAITVCQALSAVSNGSHPEICLDKVDAEVFVQNMMIGIAYAIGYGFVAFVVNTLGKRTLLVTFLLVSGSSGVALHWITTPIFINILFIGLLVLSGLCVAIVNAAVVELFPTYLRGMAMCISLMIGRLGNVFASFALGMFLEIDCTATFFTLAVILYVCAALSLMIPNQTVENKTI